MRTRQLAAVVVLCAAAGCGSEPNVHVYVDNADAVAVEVSVDEAQGVAVPAGGQAVLKLKPGKHRFQVRRQGQVVYDQSRDFPESDKLTKYVLNPDRTRRYTSDSVTYRSYSTSGRPDQDAGTALRATPLLKPDPWVSGGYDDVFDETPPDSVKLKRGTVATTRMRLCRITPEDHDRLATAQADYLKALRARPAEMPSLDDDTVAALNRVLRACPRSQ